MAFEADLPTCSLTPVPRCRPEIFVTMGTADRLHHTSVRLVDFQVA